MDLYVYRPSHTSRAVLAFCELTGIPVTVKDVNITRGEQHASGFAGMNPSRQVPILDDGGFVLTQSSAIVRYLASKGATPLYPQEPRMRARVDELVAWFEADFTKNFVYQFVYPQVMPHHALGSAEATQRTIELGRDKSRAWLSVLDGHFLRGGKEFLAGDALTIADLFGAGALSLGELVGFERAGYPNIQRWYTKVTGNPAWQKVNGPFKAYLASIEKRDFVALP